TRFSRDWSSDVCSSDLSASQVGGQPGVDVGALGHRYDRAEPTLLAALLRRRELRERFERLRGEAGGESGEPPGGVREVPGVGRRSEERRVGKEGRTRRS